ncbi:hypothetical protein E4665_02580 [Sporolactobacillus shoreae]|uniref:Uncharacterized protein n=1 Tax=Sporolactobacillus shoreae TaxID=1465501 RepID=A0A4Z0GT22_9BACL|nr:hypothetical protein [Sporolactobacillus shoreae]TGA99851.1 hypothetical protein E4665_02580 [Sporolactobacillus shoreae]
MSATLISTSTQNTRRPPKAFHASRTYQLYNEGQKQRKARMEKEAEASLPFDLKMKLVENKIERGIGQGLIDTVKDTALGIIETVQHPIQTSVGIYGTLSN